MPTIQETIEFIKKAHGGQKDKSGLDYYLHPIAVMNLLPPGVSEDVMHAALLHDVIEDTHYTRKDLSKMRYSDATLDIVDLVTKKKGIPQPYNEKIRGIIDSGNVGAILVKYADVTHNSDPARLVKLTPELATKLRNKYALPKVMLEETVKKLGYPIYLPHAAAQVR